MLKLPHNCTHLTRQQSNAQNSPSQSSTVHEPRTSRCSSWFQKRQRNQRSNCQHPLDHRTSKRFPEKHHGILASGPITSWQIDRETTETVTDFIFLGSKITAYVDCSHEIKRHLLLGRKAMTNLNSILKSRDITLPTKSIQSKLWSFHHAKNFPQFIVIHTVKDFRVVKEAEVSLDLSCFLYDSLKVKSLSHV